MIPSVNSQATQVALLAWADAMLVLLPEGRQTELKVKKPEHLFDGAVFSLFLEILDPEYNPARFQQNLDAASKRNFHIIHMGLIDFSRRHCPEIESLIKSIDFQALDREPTRLGMVEILVTFLSAACLQDDNSKYITLVQKLEPRCQQAIFQILQEVQTRSQDGPETTDIENAANTSSASVDIDLAHEAAVANLQREVEEAKKQAGSLKLRLDRLQDNYDELLGKHEDIQEENEHLHKQIESHTGAHDKQHYQQMLRENEAFIANLEGEINSLREDKTRLTKETMRLDAAAKKAEHLLDENQELKLQNEELSKKANAAEHLRQKVEALKRYEAEANSLRNDRIDLNKTFDQLTNAHHKIDTLRREGEAYATKMQGYEIDIAEMREQKLLLTQQNNELRLRMGELEQRSQVDEAVVKDLQEKVMMLDPSAVPSSPSAARPVSLEDELSESNNAGSMRSLELQRLQAENAVLRSSIGTDTEKGQLLQEMEDARASRQALQDKYNDMFERYTVGQKQLDALIQNMDKEGLVRAIQACYDMAPDTKWLMSEYIRQEAYANLRTQILAEQSRSKHLEKQLESTKEQLSDKERSLLEARGDCKAIFIEYAVGAEDADDVEKVDAVEKSGMDALAELKNTDGMLAVSLRAELDVERKKYRALKDESEAMQKQLLAAFIDKDELRREAEQANRELQRAADGQTPSTDSVKQAEKMEKLRARYKQLQQVSHFSDSSDDEEDDNVVSVDVKRQSFWDSWIGPWMGSAQDGMESPQEGFHSYEGQDVSSSASARPRSTISLRGGGASSPDSILSGISGFSAYNSPTEMDASSAPADDSERESAELKTRELERTLKAVRAGTEAGAQKAQQDQIIKNLQRENAMITTAWYDLSSRLQSNHVVLQRRNDVPRSWLNKQRQMVNATPRR
ncbi:hypothetical protein GGR56DRAFT_668928 [Xylariaceae sp. FL0804]|nr:hypothetical protein GGR56DRAFT_668928 [Xylariaceae sp. FL0804]